MSVKGIVFAIFFGAGLALTGCGPVYQTDYSFTPPKTDSGRSCTYHCETVKQQCRQIEELRVDRCEDQNRWESQRCEDELYRKKGRDSKWYECGSTQSCTADYEGCDSQYRACYESCGGRVDARTYCVSNCEKLPPAPPQAALEGSTGRSAPPKSAPKKKVIPKATY